MVFNSEESQEFLPKEPSLMRLPLKNVHGDVQKDVENCSSSSNDGSDIASYNKLPHILSSLFGTILEDTVTQLRSLDQCNNELRIIKTRSDWKHLKCIQFGIKEDVVVDDLDRIDPKHLNCDEYKINKLDADRKYVTNVITATYVDLSTNQSFKALEDSVNVVVDRENYLVTLTENEAKNRIRRRELNRQLRQQRNHIKSVIYDTDVKIHNLSSQVEDSVLLSECKGRYIDNWQGARTEQHIQTISDTEEVYSATVEYYKQRTDHEQRVHMEIEMLMNICINDLLLKVENQMAKYDKDMEAIDLKIQIQKNDYQNMLDKRIELEETIKTHGDLMKEWCDFKVERERIRAYREKMTNSAIVVQAWWRGLLVRLELGPFKVAKKKGGGGKKK